MSRRRLITFMRRGLGRIDEVAQLPGAAGGVASRYFSLGRHALEAGLRLAGIGRGDAVLVPAYICREVLASLHAVQAEPLFYPVDRTLAPCSLPMDSRVKAVIAVNYFGFPQSLGPFQDYCAKQGCVLIEDNAHGALSRDALGAPLGTRADLGIASFRKTFGIPDGAALLVNLRSLLANLPTPLPCRNERLPVDFVARQALARIETLTGWPLLGFAEQATRRVRKLRTGHAFPVSTSKAEVDMPLPAAMHCESLRSLGSVNATQEVDRRRELYKWLDHEVRGLGAEPVFSDLSAGVAPYGYAFRAADSIVGAASELAKLRGLTCSRWPELPGAVEPSAPDFYRNVLLVNFHC